MSQSHLLARLPASVCLQENHRPDLSPHIYYHPTKHQRNPMFTHTHVHTYTNTHLPHIYNILIHSTQHPTFIIAQQAYDELSLDGIQNGK